MNSEQKPVKKSAIAAHWGVSAPYVTKLGKSPEAGGKGMPEFFSLEDADAWRALNAPRKSPQPLAQKSAEAGKKNAGFSVTTSTRNKGGRGTGTDEPTAGTDEEGRPAIDVASFVRRGVDFESLMIEQAEQVPQIAFGLYQLACTRGYVSEISGANRNWHESAKASAQVRAAFLDLQERTRALIQLDTVMDIVGTELAAVRNSMLRLGERLGPSANPANPSLACDVINAGVDRIFAQLQLTYDRARAELAIPLPAPAPDLPLDPDPAPASPADLPPDPAPLPADPAAAPAPPAP